jgi:hypothetical protein
VTTSGKPIRVDVRQQLTGLTLTVKVVGKRRALWRIKIAAWLTALAAAILGGKVDLEAEFGTDG